MLSLLYKKLYQETGFFPPIVNDFLEDKNILRPLQAYSRLDSIERIAENRKKFPLDRKALRRILLRQNESHLSLYPQLKEQIDALKNENTFTICTAHQPHIALGPLYVLYKSIHTILLARHLQKKYPAYRIAPVFFIGSEDADKRELLELFAGNKRFFYETSQRGSVGRMRAEDWDSFYEQIRVKIAAFPREEELKNLLQEAYRSSTFTGAFRHILYALFGKQGLIVLDIDDEEIKTSAMPIFEKEIKERFSEKALLETSRYIDAHYRRHQLEGSDINLFHLDKDSRTKVTTLKDMYILPGRAYPISASEYISYIKNNPSSVSPNAALRPLIQEHILPNLVFVGGGGEVSYWLQLRAIFEQANVHFPLLALRHSFTLFGEKDIERLMNAGLSVDRIMGAPSFEWRDFIPKDQIDLDQSLTYRKKLNALLGDYHEYLYKNGINDRRSLEAASHKLNAFYMRQEKNILRKRKQEYHIPTIERIYEQAFPFGKLQERTQSFVEWYAMYGQRMVENLLERPIEETSAYYSAVLIK